MLIKFITISCCFGASIWGMMAFNFLSGGNLVPAHNRFFLRCPTTVRSLVGLGGTRMWLTTNIYIVGKKSAGEEWISQGCQEYEKRLSPVMNVHTHFLKSDAELIKYARQAKGTIFAMDENGKQLTSPNFSSVLFKGFEDGGSVVSFIIGGFDGLPDEIKSSYKLISLSKLTWTHQMARLLLLEQIYRAAEIRKGSAYHKE